MRFGEKFWSASKPRKAKGGIKARSQRGAFGTRWWAQRWIAVLEGLMSGGRLQRGRRYARAGQVLDLKIAPGLVTASVQGSRARPYRVTIRVATLGKPAWRKIATHIASEVRFAATLLAGEMPADIEEAFVVVAASLFPTSLQELHTDCSCPDWANPCKHVAATYYLIGEEFDRDPFLLFTLRGSSKKEILAELHDAAAAPSAARPSGPEELPLALDAFWQGAPVANVPAGVRASAAKARPRALPPFPFWRGAEPLEATLARIDDAAVATALALLADADASTGR